MNKKMGHHSYLADFFEQQLMPSLVVESRPPIFIHSDFQQKNILVQEVERFKGQKDFHISLVDWESASWYPVYWEYSAAFSHGSGMIIGVIRRWWLLMLGLLMPL